MLSAFDKTSFALAGALLFEQTTWPLVNNLTRWGTNGFGFIAPGPQLTDQEVYILTSSLAVTPPVNPLPVISGIAPTSTVAGSAPFTLTINGSGFVADSTVLWNGAGLATTYVNGTRLTATVSALDIATAGTAQVSVQNPTPGGGASANLGFTITAAPGQLSLSATTIAFGSESVGLPSPAQKLTLVNTGGQAIGFASIAASSEFSNQ